MGGELLVAMGAVGLRLRVFAPVFELPFVCLCGPWFCAMLIRVSISLGAVHCVG
jgi:hypothetical protein